MISEQERSDELSAQSSTSLYPETNSFPPSTSLSAQLPGSHSTATDNEIRTILGLSQDDPLSLTALSNPSLGGRPCQSTAVLIQLAILGSPNRRLTVKGIHEALEERFEWFRSNPEQGWQVRLSYFPVRLMVAKRHRRILLLVH